jgi:hypothetical protein
MSAGLIHVMVSLPSVAIRCCPSLVRPQPSRSGVSKEPRGARLLSALNLKPVGVCQVICGGGAGGGGVRACGRLCGCAAAAARGGCRRLRLVWSWALAARRWPLADQHCWGRRRGAAHLVEGVSDLGQPLAEPLVLQALLLQHLPAG